MLWFASKSFHVSTFVLIPKPTAFHSSLPFCFSGLRVPQRGRFFGRCSVLLLWIMEDEGQCWSIFSLYSPRVVFGQAESFHRFRALMSSPLAVVWVFYSSENAYKSYAWEYFQNLKSIIHFSRQPLCRNLGATLELGSLKATGKHWHDMYYGKSVLLLYWQTVVTILLSKLHCMLNERCSREVSNGALLSGQLSTISVLEARSSVITTFY